MKVLIDTNIAMDFMSDRIPFSDDAEKVFTFCCSGLVEGYMTVNAFFDLHYILNKHLRDKNQLKRVLSFWLKFVEILDTTSSDCRLAFESSIPDYEDAVISEAARRCGIEYIITRNINDFRKSQVPAVSSADFVKIAMKYKLESEGL